MHRLVEHLMEPGYPDHPIIARKRDAQYVARDFNAGVLEYDAITFTIGSCDDAASSMHMGSFKDMTAALLAKYHPLVAEILCPQESCPKGTTGEGFYGKIALFSHLRQSDDGHRMGLYEAHRVVHQTVKAVQDVANGRRAKAGD